MDISKEEQDAFIQALRKKYPSQFDEDPSFKTYIQDRFKLTEHETHAANFGGETDLTSLFESLVIEEPTIQDDQNETHENETSRSTFYQDPEFKTYLEERFKRREQELAQRASSIDATNLTASLETAHENKSLTPEEVRALREKKFTPEHDPQRSNETASSGAPPIHEEHSNDEPIPPTAIQPPHIAAQPHIVLFLNEASGAMDVLDEYAAGASVHEVINQLREHITQAYTIYSNEVSLTTAQQEQLKTHLAAIEEELRLLKPNHFEGKSKNDFTSIIRSMLNGFTLLFSWLGAPKDRNLVAEMTGRPFFFPRSKTEKENNTINQKLSKLDNIKDNLASAIENISDEPERPEV